MSKIKSEPNCYSVGYAYASSDVANRYNKGEGGYYLEIGIDDGPQLKNSSVVHAFKADVDAFNNAMDFIRGLNLPAHKYSLVK